VADGSWSQSTCRADVWWWGVPGQGTHYWTQRFGQYWVGGGVYQRYAAAGYECGNLGPPVKVYQWLSEFGAYGQWFAGGAIYFSGGQWRIAFGDYGQTAGRLADIEANVVALPPAGAEMPPDPPDDAPDQHPPADGTD
jgi:hypothetical protein